MAAMAELARVVVETAVGPFMGVVLLDASHEMDDYCVIWVALDDLEERYGKTNDIVCNGYQVKMPLGVHPTRVKVISEKYAEPAPPQIRRIHKRDDDTKWPKCEIAVSMPQIRRIHKRDDDDDDAPQESVSISTTWRLKLFEREE